MSHLGNDKIIDDLRDNMLTATEIDNIKVEKEKELKQLIVNHEIVEQEKLNLQREILLLQIKKKDLESMLSKSKSNIKQLQIEIGILKSQFWSARNGGL